MYALINTFDRQPNSIGTVLSLHRSEEAAAAADKRYQRDIKRSNGRSSYLPTTIARVAGRIARGQMLHRSDVVA